jgi:nucleoside-triphosphatase
VDPPPVPPRLLVTGVPGAGKTTLVRAVLSRLPGIRAAGFTTEELRGPSGRTGFKVVTLDGREARLATAREGEGPKVGWYTVHVAEFEATAVPTLAPRHDLDLYVIDEIGKMECLSAAFVMAVRRALASGVPVLATVALQGGGLIGEVKRFPGVEVTLLTRENRSRLPADLAARLLDALDQRG